MTGYKLCSRIQTWPASNSQTMNPLPPLPPTHGPTNPQSNDLPTNLPCLQAGHVPTTSTRCPSTQRRVPCAISRQVAVSLSVLFMCMLVAAGHRRSAGKRYGVGDTLDMLAILLTLEKSIVQKLCTLTSLAAGATTVKMHHVKTWRDPKRNPKNPTNLENP